jgi:thiamine-phosphate pyrophosphorylase
MTGIAAEGGSARHAEPQHQELSREGLNILNSDQTRTTTRLYLITPPALDPDHFAKVLEEALAGGDVACLQLRLKEVDDATVRRATRILQPIAQQHGVAFIMNDRPDLAAELDCDGVHVGEEDMPYAEARRLFGPDRIVGVTCGDSRHRALVAAEAGADYIAFGAFFPSGTKAAKHRAQPDLIRDWSDTTVVPCVAIGGITQENCGPLVEAGADFLAVIGAIWSYPRGPRAAVSEFNDVFARYGRAAA